ncbi:MAG: AraC family transcriptional regulator [Alphaproteobacteria bacterium]|nr:AraC family transcriptional regulator [Alphaproteobacteria bacterium]
MIAMAFGETFGEILAVESATALVSLSVHRGGATPDHCHASDHLCVVLSGAVLERSSGCTVELKPGDVLMHRRDEMHTNEFGTQPATCLNMHLGRDARLDTRVRRCTPELRSLADALARQVVLGNDALSLEADTAEFIGRILGGDTFEGDGAWLSRLIEMLDDDPKRAWALDELAQLCGRHPTHVARAFRARTGLSLGAYRRRRRATELGLRLKFGGERLADLAAELGYADQAHMCREFHAFAGITPAAYRRATRSPTRIPMPIPSANPARRPAS